MLTCLRSFSVLGTISILWSSFSLEMWAKSLWATQVTQLLDSPLEEGLLYLTRLPRGGYCCLWPKQFPLCLGQPSHWWKWTACFWAQVCFQPWSYSAQGKDKKFSSNTISFIIISLQVDSKSNIAKLVEVPIQLISPSSARDMFSRVVQVLPCGASDMPCKLLTAGYMMLLASPITDKVPELTKSPLIALVGGCSLGKTSTNSLLLNHFSDKVN